MNARTAAFLAIFSAASLTASSTFLLTPLQAQSAMVTRSESHAWERVQQLPTHTAVDVRKDKGKVLCLIDSVTPDELTCSTAKATSPGIVHLSRTEIKSVRLQNRGRSAGVGFLIGAGIGAGAGAGIGSAVNKGDSGSYAHVSSGKAVGVGAAVGGIIGGITGALIGVSRNDFGALVYRR